MSDNLYKDMILKLKYYKEEIIKSYAKQGHFPLENEIKNKLQDVDYRTSLFESYLSKPGSYFNTKEINKMFELLYKDFEFLYNVLQDLLINDYNSLKLYVETHLNELENKANMYEQRFNEEMNTSSLGTTIFFQSNNWNITTKDEYTIIDLGSIDLIRGSKIALYCNVDNTLGDSVFFKLIANDDKYSFDALPYNYNNNTYKVPGNLKINKQTLKLEGSVIVNDNLTINYSTNSDNEYKILGGTNLMTVTYKNNNNIKLINFANTNNSFYTDEECYIEFYYIDGNYLQFNFNKKPNNCNFSLLDGYIKADDDIKKIYIDAPSNFMCSFNTEEGQVWASCEEGIIKDSTSLLYSGNWDLRDFEIREYVKADKTTYNLKLYIKSNTDVKDLIKNVFIKEL